MPLAGEADAVVAVADRLVQRRVDAAGEQVVVDQPVALGDEQPGLELDASTGRTAGRGRPRSRRVPASNSSEVSGWSASCTAAMKAFMTYRSVVVPSVMSPT